MISAACTQRRLHFFLSLNFWELTNITVMHTGCTLMISSVYNQFNRLEPYLFTSNKTSSSLCVLISTLHKPLKERCRYSKNNHTPTLHIQSQLRPEKVLSSWEWWSEKRTVALRHRPFDFQKNNSLPWLFTNLDCSDIQTDCHERQELCQGGTIPLHLPLPLPPLLPPLSLQSDSGNAIVGLFSVSRYCSQGVFILWWPDIHFERQSRYVSLRT
jgi:hypothetical protein